MPRRPAHALLAVLLPGLLLLGAGCAGSRTAAPVLPEAFPHHRLDQILAHLRPPADTLQALRATATIGMRTPARSGTFTAEIEARRSDSLALRIKGPFGIEVARTLITPDSFFVLDRFNNELLYGALAYAEAFLPPLLLTGDRFATLLGFLQPDPATPWTVSADDQYYYLATPDQRRAYVIDPALWRVIRYEERDTSGTILEDRVFSEFEPIATVYLPRRLVYRRPQEETFASLLYRSLELNPSDLDLDLSVGSSVRRVPIAARE